MEHFYKGRPVHRLMLNESDESTNEIHDINNTNFYKKQKRIALHNCGVIDPENIQEYIAKRWILCFGESINRNDTSRSCRCD